MNARFSDLSSWGNQRDDARTDQFGYILARLDELRSDFIKHQQYIDKSKEFQEDTRTVLKALGQRVCVETAARSDTVHSTQAWPSDVMSGGSQRNASEEKSDREDPAVWGVGSARKPRAPTQ